MYKINKTLINWLVLFLTVIATIVFSCLSEKLRIIIGVTLSVIVVIIALLLMPPSQKSTEKYRFINFLYSWPFKEGCRKVIMEYSSYDSEGKKMYIGQKQVELCFEIDERIMIYQSSDRANSEGGLISLHKDKTTGNQVWLFKYKSKQKSIMDNSGTCHEGLMRVETKKNEIRHMEYFNSKPSYGQYKEIEK